MPGKWRRRREMKGNQDMPFIFNSISAT